MDSLDKTNSIFQDMRDLGLEIDPEQKWQGRQFVDGDEAMDEHRASMKPMTYVVTMPVRNIA